jgi:hypothetical protein
VRVAFGAAERGTGTNCDLGLGKPLTTPQRRDAAGAGAPVSWFVPGFLPKWCARTKDHLRQAVADFTRAIELRPDAYDCYRGRALAYRVLGDVASAVRDERTMRTTTNWAQANRLD